MSEARNTGSIFTDCTFRNARFNESVHADAAFVNCTHGCTAQTFRTATCVVVTSAPSIPRMRFSPPRTPVLS